jgi:hypothetical protein
MKISIVILFMVIAISQSGCVATYDLNGTRIIKYQEPEKDYDKRNNY